MERRYGDHSYTLDPVNDTLQARPSIESITSARLQKKRSVKRARSDANRLTAKPARVEPYGRLQEDNHQRKSSLRDAVKKIFSRRSKVTGQDVSEQSNDPYAARSSVQTTPLKLYNSHSGQPSPAPFTDVSERAGSTPLRISPDVLERTGSAPLRRDTTLSVDLPRLRSPNAVEFPKSRHLKPLTLPSPFDDPRSTLRRRKTLPSILVAPEDAREIAAALRGAEKREEPTSPLPTKGLSPNTSRKAKRRSRSAGDLRDALLASPQRKRSAEIRFWRESIQTAILRTSNYTIDPETAVIESQGPRTPLRNSVLEQRTSIPRASPGFEIRSSMYGTELSRELEDRVAKLEANLQSFQRSLDRLQAGSKRRLELNEGRGRDSTDYRTPSMLAEDLRLPLAPSQYQYGFEPNDRPQTATSRPIRPPRPDEAVPPVPSMRYVTEESRSSRPQSPMKKSESRPRRPSRPDDPIASLPPTSQDDLTVRSLYQMLKDERSARHKLETQINNMRNEISDLQQQVSAQSQIQSQRSSYLYPAQSDITAGSSRLRELLAEAEALSRRSMSSPMPGLADRVVSRFSASTRQESEAEHTQVSSEELVPEQDIDRPKEKLSRLQISDRLVEEPATTGGSEQAGFDDFKTPTQAASFPIPPTFKQEGGMF